MPSSAITPNHPVAERIYAERRRPRGTRQRARNNLVERVRKTQTRLRDSRAALRRRDS